MTLSITGKKSLAAGKAGRRGDASHETAWEVDDAHRIKEGNGIAGWLFVVPALLIALTFVIVPFINTVRLSFTDATFSNPGHFVGLEQYQKMFSDESVHIGLLNSSLYVVCVVPCMVILPLILAALVSGNS